LLSKDLPLFYSSSAVALALSVDPSPLYAVSTDGFVTSACCHLVTFLIELKSLYEPMEALKVGPRNDLLYLVSSS